MKTLVTGAGGFLGQYLVERLIARGDSVRAFVRRPNAELEQLGVEVVLGDIRDPVAVARACEQIDVVHHTAAIAGIWGPWRDFYEINTLGTEHVIAGCRKHRVPKLVYTSSPSVTFDGGDQSGINESAPYATQWLAHYPHSKALAEAKVLAAHDDRGLLTCALRPHLIWGPRDRHLVPRLIDRAYSGRLLRVGAGENLIDMIYVDNAAEAQLQAADALAPGSPVGGRAYFLSQGEPVNCWQWIDQLLELAWLRPVRRSISLGAAYAIGAVLEAVWRTARLKSEPPMTRFLAAQLGRDHWFDISAARRDFGYRPIVSTDEGMQRLKKWLRADP
ncbi:MAG TPA: NAD-dependent epimerase/dehydratase family protein, partial [Pirellulales bacterium]|nr:NAD-dependent epimerase/dehydratase family protein [Pirellulales bacterium]